MIISGSVWISIWIYKNKYTNYCFEEETKNEKIIYKVDDKEVSKEVALSDDMYSIYYYLQDDFLDKIESFYEGELTKVIYTEREKPFDSLLKDHFSEYKDIVVHIRTKEIIESNDQSIYTSYIYISANELDSISECLIDNDGVLLKEFRLDEDGNKHGWDEYLYDETGELERIKRYNKDNKLINEEIFSE